MLVEVTVGPAEQQLVHRLVGKAVALRVPLVADLRRQDPVVVGRGCGEHGLHAASLRDPVELGSQLRIARAGDVNAGALGERS